MINFNFFTDAKVLQTNMEAPLEKKTGTNYGPPGKAALVYFLDDLNLPEVDKYNTQSAIALVRQQFDYGHWYERSKFLLRNLLNCQVRGRGSGCVSYTRSLTPTPPPSSTSRA